MEWVAIGTANGDVVIWDVLQAESLATMVNLYCELLPAISDNYLLFDRRPVTLLCACVTMETASILAMLEVM